MATGYGPDCKAKAARWERKPWQFQIKGKNSMAMK